jgi:hypothetical protein
MDVHLWSNENPGISMDIKCDLQKSVFFAFSKTQFYSPFFFTESTISGMVYLDTLEQWL